MRRLLAAVTAMALTPGCATIFHGTSETIHVRSEVPDTTFYAGAQEIGKGTSAVTTIEKKALKKTTLRAEKPPCNTKTTPLMTAFDGVSLLGILLDLGLISILVVDGAATGAWTHATQTDYILTPECPEGRPVLSPSEAPSPAPSGPVATPRVSTPPATSSPEVHPQPTPAPRVSTGPSGRLRVLTDPAGADVYIGNLRAGVTTPEGLLLELPAGSVTVSVRKAGYLSVERTLTVDPSKDVVLPFTLRASPQQ